MRIDSSFIPLPVQRPTTTGARLPVSAPQGVSADRASRLDQADGGFTEILREALARVNDTQQQADIAVQQVATGEADDLHGAIIALEQADLTLRLTAQVAQRAVSAYQEISRMQI